MSYRIAGIDVHKKMLAVVVANVAVEGEFQFERRRFGTTPDHLRLLTEWLIEQEVVEVVMESTAQYWQPVWGALERYWQPIFQKREEASLSRLKSALATGRAASQEATTSPGSPASTNGLWASRCSLAPARCCITRPCFCLGLSRA